MRKQGKQLSQEVINQIINLYNSGMTMVRISEKLNVDKNTVSRHLMENGLIEPKGKCLEEDAINTIVDRYLSGISICNIAKEIGIGRHTVSKYVNAYLAQNNLERRNDAHRKYTLNEHYFDEIDTPNKAYILGFWYADGCNMKSKSTISISLEEHDRDILEAMRLELESTRPLEFVKQSERLGKDSPYNYKDLWMLQVFSIHMCEELERKGMPPNKSLILTFPDWLREDLYPHFVRGYFDGDGCIRSPKHSIQLTFTSTNMFCLKLLKYLMDNNVVGNGYIYDASCHNGVTSVLTFNMYDSLLLASWMYKDADLMLNRKYQRYCEHLQKYQSIA